MFRCPRPSESDTQAVAGDPVSLPGSWEIDHPREICVRLGTRRLGADSGTSAGILGASFAGKFKLEIKRDRCLWLERATRNAGCIAGIMHQHEAGSCRPTAWSQREIGMIGAGVPGRQNRGAIPYSRTTRQVDARGNEPVVVPIEQLAAIPPPTRVPSPA